jgi:very-short-patch-repair endonuclease
MLDELGVTAGERRGRVRRGEWRRTPSGVLIVAGAPETFEMRATAALLAVDESVLSHQTAGQVLDVDVSDELIHLAIPDYGRSHAYGVKLHRTTLAEEDVVRRKGFPVTSMERTLVDLASVLSLRDLRRCVEDQLVRRTTTFDRVESTFNRLATRGRPGIARMRRLLAEIDGQPPTESELEAMFVRLLARHGLPRPQRQVTFEWMEKERGRVDFLFPHAQLIIEVDGRRFHERSKAFESDRRRDQLALVHGLRTVRFTHRQVSRDAEFVVDVVRRLLAM